MLGSSSTRYMASGGKAANQVRDPDRELVSVSRHSEWHSPNLMMFAQRDSTYQLTEYGSNTGRKITKNEGFEFSSTLSNISESIVGQEGPTMVYLDRNNLSISLWP